LNFLIAAFLSFLPVIDKFENAKKFILQLILNKGTYGVGERGILDTDMLFSTLGKLYHSGENFVWFFVLASLSILIYLLFAKGKKENRKKTTFLVGFLVASILMALLVSKNFKDYYLIPTLGVSGIVTFLALHFISYYFRLNKLIQTFLAIAVFGFLFIPTLSDLSAVKEIKKQKRQARLETRDFIDQHIGPDNYWFLEPGWISGPFEVNGLLWGISYVANKNDFTENYMKAYPKVLTYEGDNKPIKHFRTKDAEIDKIFNENTPVYLFSTPGLRTHLLQQELKNQSKALNLNVTYDTIFTNVNNKDRVIKASFHQTNDSIAYTTITSFNDMEDEYTGWKQNALSKELAFSGGNSCKIKKGQKYSSTFELNTIDTIHGAINSIKVQAKVFQERRKTSFIMILEITNKKGNKFGYTVFCSDYLNTQNEWEDFEYRMFIPLKYNDTKIIKLLFKNDNKKAAYIDNISVSINGY